MGYTCRNRTRNRQARAACLTMAFLGLLLPGSPLGVSRVDADSRPSALERPPLPLLSPAERQPADHQGTWGTTPAGSPLPATSPLARDRSGAGPLAGGQKQAPVPVPEPATIFLVGTGLTCLAYLYRRRAQK